MVVALIVLGPDKLPQAARNVAKVYREIRSFSTSVRSQVEEALEIDDRPKPPSAGNPTNPDLSGFTLVEDPAVSATPTEPQLGAPLFRPDSSAPPQTSTQEER